MQAKLEKQENTKDEEVKEEENVETKRETNTLKKNNEHEERKAESDNLIIENDEKIVTEIEIEKKMENKANIKNEEQNEAPEKESTELNQIQDPAQKENTLENDNPQIDNQEKSEDKLESQDKDVASEENQLDQNSSETQKQQNNQDICVESQEKRGLKDRRQTMSTETKAQSKEELITSQNGLSEFGDLPKVKDQRENLKIIEEEIERKKEKIITAEKNNELEVIFVEGTGSAQKKKTQITKTVHSFIMKHFIFIRTLVYISLKSKFL